MGFDTLAADLTRPETHDPAFWAPHLAGGAHLVNAAGLLTGSEAAMEAVHLRAPAAAWAALHGGHGLLISAVGIDAADTPFARWRRAGEALVAGKPQVTILRPGLVLADTSYGGSSLLRAMAAMPFRTPVIGDGTQPFNPIHALDLARIAEACLLRPPGPGPWEVGGPETVTQASLIRSIRSWLGLPGRPILRLPLPLARQMGRMGDLLGLGPVSRTAVAQLEAGVLADPRPITAASGLTARPFAHVLLARPAATQDLWQARLYLLKPLIRLALSALWLVSGLIGLFLPAEDFLPLFAQSGLSENLIVATARIGGVADLALGVALLLNLRPRLTGIAQLALVLAYTVGLTVVTPAEWLAPFGGLLKNIAILPLILAHLALTEER